MAHQRQIHAVSIPVISVSQIKAYFSSRLFLSLLFASPPTSQINCRLRKVSSFCVYYLNPLTATICLRTVNSWMRGEKLWQEKTSCEGCANRRVCDAWWLLFKNSSRANFHPMQHSTKGVNNLHRVKLKISSESVTEQTNDKRVVDVQIHMRSAVVPSDYLHLNLHLGHVVWLSWLILSSIMCVNMMVIETFF